MIEGQKYKHLYVREKTHGEIKSQAKKRGMTAINYIELLSETATELMVMAYHQAEEKKLNAENKDGN